MQRIFRHLAAGLLTAALLCTQNVHLPVLQAAAWAGMIVTYAQEDGIAAAIQETFDGAHPCKLCRAIKAEQTKTHATIAPAPLPPNPMGTAPDVRTPVQPPSESRIEFIARILPGEPQTFPPPVPPPREVS